MPCLAFKKIHYEIFLRTALSAAVFVVVVVVAGGDIQCKFDFCRIPGLD